MEAIILSSEQFLEISKQLKEISSTLEFKSKEPSEKFIDNQEFIMLMKISKRTAQIWRDEGKISFSQIGAKIYYKLSDVETLLNNNYRKAFAR
jgi:hypothetical protein